jgi:hypothetical protein
MYNEDFANTLSLVNWKLNKAFKSVNIPSKEESDVANGIENNQNLKDEPTVVSKPIVTEGSDVIQLVLTQKEFNLYKANNSSIKRFIDDLLSWCAISGLKVVSENDQLSSGHVVFCGCEDGEERVNNFFTLEQIFYYPPRKKILFDYLNMLHASSKKT